MLVCIFFVFGALVGYAYLLWKKKKSCLKRKKNRKQTEEEGKLRAIRKEDYRYVRGVQIKTNRYLPMYKEGGLRPIFPRFVRVFAHFCQDYAYLNLTGAPLPLFKYAYDN